MTAMEHPAPGLEALDEAAREKIRQRGRELAIEAGTVIFRPGGECNAFFWIIEGTVRVQMVAESGRELVLYRVSPGQTCIMTTSCLLASASYSAEGVAETDVAAVALGADLFDELLAESAEFRSLIFSSYGARIAGLLASFEEIAFGRLDRRLARLLVERAVDGRLALTHQRIAEELGSAREVISRLLKEYEHRGWISLSRGAIDIVNIEGLRQAMHDGLL